MWNNLNLVNPIHDLCEYGEKDAVLMEDLPNLVSMLTTSAESLTEDHPIWEEIQVFGNVQAKYKRTLRCDKSLQLLQRVGHCLRKMVLLNLSKEYLNLGERILTEIHNPKRSSVYFLPSRQQLEFVLIRTQTAAKLICEALHYSRETFCFLIQRLKAGQLIVHLIMVTSVTARLNIVFKSLLSQVFHMYKNLYKWRQKLKKGGWEWPKHLDLPEDLKEWLNTEEPDRLKPKHLPKDELDFLTSIFDENGVMNGPNVEDEDVILLKDSVGARNKKKRSEKNEVEAYDNCIVIDDDNENIIDESGDSSVLSAKEHNESGVDKEEPQILYLSMSEEEDNIEINKELTKAQTLLLKKIKAAENLKSLKVIWENIDVTSQDLLPKGLTPIKIRFIDKLFVELKRQITELHSNSNIVVDKEKELKFLVKIAGLKFAKYLKLLPKKKGKSLEKSVSDVKLKPVNNLIQLREQYDFIYQKLQTVQAYKKCAKLSKFFKSRRADIKLLRENEGSASAKQLICSTSKFLLSNYLE